MQISFYGASQEVTGSNYLIEHQDKKILVDCGLFQGSRLAEDKNYSQFQYDPKQINALVLTHAHLDHCGRLPKLIGDGFAGVIYSTPATKELARIVLEDAAHLMLEDSERNDHQPLYTMEDLARVFNNWQTVEYHKRFTPVEGIGALMIDSGHILGSASVEFSIDNQKVAFSGDLGNPPVPFLRPTETFDSVRHLIIESTYGARIHEDSKQRSEKLNQAILQSIQEGGTLMIPAFAIERTQEILYEINHLVENRKIPSVPIFLDSPMAIKATEVFARHSELFNNRDKEQSKIDNLLHFPGLKVTTSVQSSKEINNFQGPKIIIAGAGMMSGGRILHHAKRYLPDQKSTLLIVGYQVKGSLGRRLLDGEKQVKIHGEEIFVKASIKAIGAYSAHADKIQLIDFVDAIHPRPNKIFITHGELEQAQGLASEIKKHFSVEATIPKLNDSFSL